MQNFLFGAGEHRCRCFHSLCCGKTFSLEHLPAWRLPEPSSMACNELFPLRCQNLLLVILSTETLLGRNCNCWRNLCTIWSVISVRRSRPKSLQGRHELFYLQLVHSSRCHTALNHRWHRFNTRCLRGLQKFTTPHPLSSPFASSPSLLNYRCHTPLSSFHTFLNFLCQLNFYSHFHVCSDTDHINIWKKNRKKNATQKQTIWNQLQSRTRHTRGSTTLSRRHKCAKYTRTNAEIPPTSLKKIEKNRNKKKGSRKIFLI